ncbi:hypothetical protein [Streptomyces cinerochromogenes]
MSRLNPSAPSAASNAESCTRASARAALTAVIDDTPYTVAPAPAHTPA